MENADYRCWRCEAGFTKGWSCPYCGYVRLHAVVPAVLISLVLLAFALFFGKIPQIHKLDWNVWIQGLRLLSGEIGTGLLIWVGIAFFTAHRPRTRKARAIQQQDDRHDLAGLTRSMADPDRWLRNFARSLSETYSPQEFQNVPHSLRAQAASMLLADLETESINEERDDIISRLGSLGDLQAAEPLLKYLDDPDDAVRQSTAWALGIIGSHLKDSHQRLKIATSLIESMNSPDEFIWHNAALSLGRIKDQRALEILPAFIRLHSNDGTFAACGAAEGLGYIGSPALPAIRGLLLDPMPDVRGYGVYALIHFANWDANPAVKREIWTLMKAASQDPDEQVGSFANRYLWVVKN